MNEIIKINYENAKEPTVSGRELHEALEVKTKYADWFKRMCDYGFTENSDYLLVSQKSETNNPKNPHTTITDHELTIPMAKEICMMQRTEKGKEIRRYFISVEEQWNSPEAVMARALQFAEDSMKKLKITISKLEVKNSSLAVENQIMKPKADYFDELVDRNLLTNIRETAKQLNIKQKVFVNFLLEKKYLFRDKRGNLTPYSEHVTNGIFEKKEFVNDKTGYASVQTLITPKGRETFRLLCIE